MRKWLVDTLLLVALALVMAFVMEADMKALMLPLILVVFGILVVVNFSTLLAIYKARNGGTKEELHADHLQTQ